MFEDEYLDSFMEDQLSGGPNFPYEEPEWDDHDILDDLPEWDPADDYDEYYDYEPNPYDGTYSEE